jgi:hypothetical protein
MDDSRPTRAYRRDDARRPPPSASSGRAAVGESTNDLIQVGTDQELVILEVPKPHVVIAVGLGQQRIEVDETNGNDRVVRRVRGLILRPREDAKASCGHADFLLRALRRGSLGPNPRARPAAALKAEAWNCPGSAG